MIRRTRISVLVGAIGLVLPLASVVSGQSGDAIPGGLYIGTASGDCQGGVITAGPEMQFQLNDDGTGITTFTVTDLVTPLGSFERLGIPITIRINEDGSFDEEFDPLNLGLALVHLAGQFEGDSVSGSFTVEVDGTVECSGTFTMQGSPPPERPPVTYFGTIETVDRDCGGGGMELTVSGSRISVSAILVRNLNVHGTPTRGAATFSESTVPISEDGSFGWTYFPGSEVGQEIAVNGSISTVLMSGTVTVSPSECGAMPFAGRSPVSLGRGGAGPGPGRSQASPWLAVLGATGVVLVALGAALRRTAASR